ncbi:hemolysin III family protein [Desulfopila sp. IMCC35008]|uniref:PAQR family membrane homeostasis protein TrhA n=1 Tax=Desulfopila sp. IMCC35008 TaxID=2653858 RepID=UPI0013D721DD|nr:hemolysin III family protein [Desulfopila sp. IMCC35008]
MTSSSTSQRYTFYEELANSITHGVGLLFAVSALGVLTAFSSVFGTVWHIVSCSVYSATMILMYAASTLYHSIPWPKAKRVLRILDHSAIFLLIAGTYTPFTLVSLNGPWGWSLFGVIWGLAVLGILCEIFLLRKYRFLAVCIYVAMGWTIVVATKPLLSAVPMTGLVLLLIGGLFYTVGIIFYVSRKMPFHHAVWHLFVLAGTVFQFFAILLYVIPVFS